jgi:hypothetical protein
LLAQRTHSCPELLLNFLGWFGKHRSNRNSQEDHKSTDFTPLSMAGSQIVNNGEFADRYSNPTLGAGSQWHVWSVIEICVRAEARILQAGQFPLDQWLCCLYHHRREWKS